MGKRKLTLHWASWCQASRLSTWQFCGCQAKNSLNIFTLDARKMLFLTRNRVSFRRDSQSAGRTLLTQIVSECVPCKTVRNAQSIAMWKKITNKIKIIILIIISWSINSIVLLQAMEAYCAEVSASLTGRQQRLVERNQRVVTIVDGGKSGWTCRSNECLSLSV